MSEILVDRKHNYAETVWLNVSECPVCGIVYGVPQDYMDRRQSNGGDWYCPNGHVLHFTKLAVDKQRERAEAAERRATNAENAARIQRQRAEAEQRRASAYEGQATKIRNRIAQGVCPVPACCRRSGFSQVMRHIASKHPSWVVEHAHEIA